MDSLQPGLHSKSLAIKLTHQKKFIDFILFIELNQAWSKSRKQNENV